MVAKRIAANESVSTLVGTDKSVGTVVNLFEVN